MEHEENNDLDFTIPESRLHIQNLIDSTYSRAGIATLIELQCRILSRLEEKDLELMKDEAFALRNEKQKELMVTILEGFKDSKS